MGSRFRLHVIERPPKLFRLLFPGAFFRAPGKEKRIYLTFDDGPIPEVTPWVLDLLDHYGIKATFFMVGQNVERYPEIMREVKRRGHMLGNHTLHHIQGAKVSTKRYLLDVERGAELTGSHLFRPPHGWLRPAQSRILLRKYRLVMYDLVSRDYSRRLSAEDVIDNIRVFARPGSIIVFHDSLKSWPRLQEALPHSIEWLLSEGYTFHTIPDIGY